MRESIPFERLLVIGGSGAGKSTFATRLAALTGHPLIHLDREFWQPGWQMPERGSWRATVASLVAQPRWIMEGNFGSSLDLRLPRADAVIWFDYPRHICLARVMKRIWRSYGRVRQDMAPGCPEKLDPSFLGFVWTFNDRERPQIERVLATHGGHLRPTVFRRDGDVRRFMASLPGPPA